MQKILSFILIFFLLSSCKKEQKLFSVLSSENSNIDFSNLLTETETDNILAYEYFYNGGGVASGDFNNDGLIDLYFTGNQVDNELYLNKGDLTFEKITTKAGVAGRKGDWKTGVSIIDINADGWQDIYVCYSGNKEPSHRKNQLFINNHNLTFSEKAEEYGLADMGYSTQAAWLDYDGDGDLDMYLLNHNLRGYQRKEAADVRNERDEFAGDKLFRNESSLIPIGGEGKDIKGKIHFTDVSEEAGISGNAMSFGLGVSVSDVNNDNLPDIYVTNDYVEEDYLYINQGNGKFKNSIKEQTGHTSRFAMGVDIADFNNDGLQDIFTLDMLPEDNFRQKKLIFPDNWNIYQAELDNNFHHQNMRNMLQLNNGDNTFSEIGQIAGVSNTDWSWAGLFADFDNDGFKDLFVSNGLGRDYTDADFVKYYSDEQSKEATGQAKKSFLEHLKQMPSSKTHQYIFKNNHDLTFSDKSKDWGFDEPTVANGAVYADLDNDGDLEIITNNINETAKIYKNNLQETHPKQYLKIKIKGSPQNPFGIGVKIQVNSIINGQERQQVFENQSSRGFQSSVAQDILVGIDSSVVYAVSVKWGGKDNFTSSYCVGIKRTETFNIEYFKSQDCVGDMAQIETEQFTINSPPKIKLTKTNSLNFTHTENPLNDFDRQVLLPQHYSYSGSRMAVGDVNADGLEDVYCGGAREQSGVFFLQAKSGQFTPKPQLKLELEKTFEDRDAVFFDADGDKDLDLYVVSGDYGLLANDSWQHDRLYLNDGKGNFTKNEASLPAETANGSCVKTFDLENDGDQDLFVGGSVTPGKYPLSDESFILVNDGKGKFSKQSLGSIGLVSDAAVDDVDKDKLMDLIIVGEWMPITILKNSKKGFNMSNIEQIENSTGWWNTIEGADLDLDGDTDFVLGNIGQNHQMKASEQEPISLLYGDFDKNETIDPYMSYYIQGKNYPAFGRDEALEQVVSLKKKFTDFKSYAEVTMEDLFSSDDLAEAKTLQITETRSIILENIGKKFIKKPLPIQAQFAPVHAILIIQKLNSYDILLAGNNSKFRMRIGKMDANYGCYLMGGIGSPFKYLYIPQYASQFHVKGDVKDIKKLGTSIIFGLCDGQTQVYDYRVGCLNP
jgi:enediyne biosynthesis protein E4